MYDVIIVGAGPSGATLARTLPAHLKVLLIDRRNLVDESSTNGRVKVCGGLIAPAAQKMLAHMGLGLPQHVLVTPQVFAVRAIDCGCGTERFYQRYYMNVDREKLDKFLVSLCENMVEIRNNSTITSFIDRGDSVEIGGVADGIRFKERCRILFGADGANSLVRRHLVDGGIKKTRKYLAIQESFEVDNAAPLYTVLFDSDITDYYSWAIPKSDMLLVGSAVRPGKDAMRTHQKTIDWLKKYGFTLNRSLRRNSAYVERPRRHKDVCGGYGRTLLIGEAAGLISPSSAEGFSYAFLSALMAANTFCEELEVWTHRYRREVASLRLNIALKNLKSKVIYSPGIRKILMKSGLSAMTVRKTNTAILHLRFPANPTATIGKSNDPKKPVVPV